MSGRAPGVEQSRDEIESCVSHRINNEPETCDLLMSLFVSALESHRKNVVCDPFPEEFVKRTTREDGVDDVTKEFETVKNSAKTIPEMMKMKQTDLPNLTLPILRLTAWIVDTGHTNALNIERISLQQYKNETKSIAIKQSKVSEPNFVFKITYEPHHPNNDTWKRLSESYGFTFGFHGSAFEDFHSIVRKGLDDDISLSEDRDVVFGFLKCGHNFYQNSIFREEVGCIAFCEVIKDPTRFSTSKPSSGLNEQQSFMVVKDKNYVRVKYILVYRSFQRNTKKTDHWPIIVGVVVLVMVVLYFIIDNL